MKCGLCLKKNAQQFLDLGKQPMANKYPKKSEFKKEKFYPVKVFFCPDCKNVQLGTQVSRDTMFTDYYYLSSVNENLVKHYTEFARTKLSKAKFVLDIGSNDGILLKPLKEMGMKALGIDPSVNVGKLANAAGYETLVSFFNAKSGKKIAKEYGRPDVITGLSMFSHLQDPHTFLKDVHNLLKDDGKLIIEVEYNRLMLEKMAFERFYLDRIFYFSATSFQALFKKHGMYLSDVEVTDIHGGSLRVTAQKKGKGKPPTARVAKLIAEEKKALTLEKAIEFGLVAHYHVTDMRDILSIYKSKGYTIGGYGAPARMGTITNFGKMGTELFEYIVDDSPLKQGRHSPGKHIPIKSFEHYEKNPTDFLVIFAYESFRDIKKKMKGQSRYLFPIPLREVA